MGHEFALPSTELPLSLSITHGPADSPLLDFKLADFLDFQCKAHGLEECLIIPWTGARWTYDFLRLESIMLARGLASMGIRPGDRVALMAGNCEQYVAVFFACTRIGAVLVILNNNYTASEAQHALEFTGCRLLFTTWTIGSHDNHRLLDKLSQAGRTIDVVILRGFSATYQSYDALVEAGSVIDDLVLDDYSTRFTNHDVCNLQFTSGTTGHPKAAMLTHHSILNNSRFIGDRMCLTNTDILCCPPPLFHCFGLVLGLLATITHGGKVVYPSETFDARACLSAITGERCTAIHGVPAMFDAMFALPRPLDFNNEHRLRTGIIAGAPVPQHLMELMVQDFGMVEFTSSYGLTEASPTCFNADFSDSIARKLTTVGSLMPYMHAKVVDRVGHIVPIGTRGELCIAGYQLQKGYWKNPAKTDEVMIRDEQGVTWLHTGDEAILWEDGTCTITGRFKDIIIRGGENIYPLEIEERLIQHDSIERAIVVGVEHKKYGEVVATFLQRKVCQPKLTNEQVRQWVRDQLGRHKAPAHVFWLGERGVPANIPLTGSGKVKKFEMARLAEKLLTRLTGGKL